MSASDRHQTSRRLCNKCSGRLVHAVTIMKTVQNEAYEIYQCVDCNAVEWVPQTE